MEPGLANTVNVTGWLALSRQAMSALVSPVLAALSVSTVGAGMAPRMARP